MKKTKKVKAWAIVTAWGGVCATSHRASLAKLQAEVWMESSKRKYFVVPCTIVLKIKRK